MESGEWWLLQDNDPKHKSKEVQTWLHNHGVSVLDFPPYSPDLNPALSTRKRQALTYANDATTSCELLLEFGQLRGNLVHGGPLAWLNREAGEQQAVELIGRTAECDAPGPCVTDRPRTV